MLQSTTYHFLEGRIGGTCSNWKTLKLHSTTCFGDPKKIAHAMGKLSANIGLNLRVTHLEGESIFGSKKKKLNLPP
jgi:hypothetical protein